MQVLSLLIVDDDRAIRDNCTLVLEGFVIQLAYLSEPYRFDITQAKSAEEAKALCDEKAVDLMLLDQKLPGMQGTDLLEHMHKNNRDMQTIMITGFTSLDTAVKATRNGAYEILAKPFTPDELRASVFKAAQYLILQRIVAKLDQEKKKARFEFISVLSHELKSPLSAVEGYLNIIRQRMLGDNIADYDDFLERSVMRLDGMRKLIIDLLDMTRIESGVRARNIEKLSMAQLVGFAVDGAAKAAADRGIVITQNIPESVLIEADRTELEIVINNLVSNAVKYNRDNGTVRLEAKADGGTLVFTCADTGIGMNEEDRARLFKEFARIKNEKTRGILGSGLGLSIVKKVCSLYEGDIAVASKEGEGSMFTVTLKGVIPGDANMPDNKKTRQPDERQPQ